MCTHLKTKDGDGDDVLQCEPGTISRCEVWVLRGAPAREDWGEGCTLCISWRALGNDVHGSPPGRLLSPLNTAMRALCAPLLLPG